MKRRERLIPSAGLLPNHFDSWMWSRPEQELHQDLPGGLQGPRHIIMEPGWK